MTELIRGNLFDADVEALVNTVNSVGVMGRGVALQFKQAFPDNYQAYEAACRRGEVQPGKMFVFHRNTFHNPKFIINFPTKRHWRARSKIEDIGAGLDALVDVIVRERISSVAVPPLGCGSGGLQWDDVRPRIESAFERLPQVKVLLYVPEGAPAPEKMKVRTARPKMTRGRAAIIGLMERYGEPGYRMSLLEIQKLAYFLQVSGEPLKLQFAKQRYGPYTETLHYVLQRIEGHFIRGYGDRSRATSVRLLPRATEEAHNFIRSEHDTAQRFERVAQLIDGFESPYGMELLATVHWVAMNENPAARFDVEEAVRAVKGWSEHKRVVFRPQHIRTAWSRLRNYGWI